MAANRRLESKEHRLNKLIPLGVDERLSHFVEVIEPRRTLEDLVLSQQNQEILAGLLHEFRHSDTLRRHALTARSKLLFCGPPGCGKTITAEILAKDLGLPLFVARLDGIISSFLGETASNLRKTFDIANTHPCVLFLDEFDALARARSDNSEHNELRRVVNSLLMMIDHFRGRGFLIAASNLEETLDSAVWRRFDEVMLFDLPKDKDIRRLLVLKTRNFKADFPIEKKTMQLRGLSYADIERICMNSIKRSILEGSRTILESEFESAVREERRRQAIRVRVKPRNPRGR
ncbi:AAA family ATPase [Methyloceanibacter superfactus]|uniref:AAA family ATPase n=1 Tax=Methyloceanibacter superfactus TaxID=1774969 RepID=UPI000B11D67C|nr:ATP-binding protein [Methyloceanibacter superfactus]